VWGAVFGGLLHGLLPPWDHDSIWKVLPITTSITIRPVPHLRQLCSMRILEIVDIPVSKSQIDSQFVSFWMFLEKQGYQHVEWLQSTGEDSKCEQYLWDVETVVSSNGPSWAQLNI
jgi:hypothetical protein